ncbi:hypothetical protein ACUUL3_16830 [Thiovibrio sp. JS02]
MSSPLGSFFFGQSLAYAGEVGELEAKLEDALKELKKSRAEAAARRELHRALSAVLEEIAPDHPLAQDEKQNEILEKAWKKALSAGV